MGTNTVKNSTLGNEHFINFFINNTALASIVVVSIMLVLILLMIIYLNNLKFKKKLTLLKEAYVVRDFKIEQLELKIRKEERERIAQNLHDDVAGTLAAVKNSIDIAILDRGKEDNKLNEISQLVGKAYNNVRSASHNLFDSSQESEEELFSQHIQQLSSMIFPSNKYAFNFDIDDDALQNIPLVKRFELIKVLKEAFVNIVKHSKASQIDLLVYQENENLHVSLKDNGVGIENDVKKNSLGLNSMQKRIKKINGLLNINTNKTGVELEILIPG